ncbi:hypothetical protein ACFQX4_24690 [Roseomonas sp. GCM10028921]
MPAMTMPHITLGMVEISAVAAAFIKWSFWAENNATHDDWNEEWDEAQFPA